MSAEIDIKVLRLNCRRGNAEAEMLLMPYTQAPLVQTDAQERELFAQLLHENDQNLFIWLMNPDTVEEPYHSLIQRIRTYYLQPTA